MLSGFAIPRFDDALFTIPRLNHFGGPGRPARGSLHPDQKNADVRRGDARNARGLADGHRQRQQQFDGAEPALLRPEAHGECGDQQQEHPGQEVEEGREVGLAAVEEIAEVEGQGWGDAPVVLRRVSLDDAGDVVMPIPCQGSLCRYHLKIS